MQYTNMINMIGGLQAVAQAETGKQFEWGKNMGPGFIWEKQKGEVPQELVEQFRYGKCPRPKGMALNPFIDLVEYCWIVYSKALYAKGAQLVGRQSDLWVPKYLEKVGISDTNTQTLWTNFTDGNIQVMDKWSPTVNDCWVLGGVHRKADFELESIRNEKNIWDYAKNLPVVTAREILGLLHFGYEFQEQPGSVRLVCKTPADAEEATIEDYNRFMKETTSKGAAWMISIVQGKTQLKNQAPVA